MHSHWHGTGLSAGVCPAQDGKHPLGGISITSSQSQAGTTPALPLAQLSTSKKQEGVGVPPLPSLVLDHQLGSSWHKGEKHPLLDFLTLVQFRARLRFFQVCPFPSCPPLRGEEEGLGESQPGSKLGGWGAKSPWVSVPPLHTKQTLAGAQSQAKGYIPPCYALAFRDRELGQK